ncbi:MAG TPA: hypothetical protein VLG13_00770 [Patescibacteria group bacterium]|nr:hypothetical protein [Patescibacteria group bacterium]
MTTGRESIYRNTTYIVSWEPSLYTALRRQGADGEAVQRALEGASLDDHIDAVQRATKRAGTERRDDEVRLARAATEVIKTAFASLEQQLNSYPVDPIVRVE